MRSWRLWLITLLAILLSYPATLKAENALNRAKNAKLGHSNTFNQSDFNKLADAIYLSEGGIHARRPFGILSVACNSYNSCHTICLNTIRNSYKRYQRQPCRNEDFISFLGRRYAPIGALNDPSNLNSNWVKNVRWFYAH